VSKFVQLTIFFVLLCSMYSATANPVTPSPAMMEQFKQLPRAEQEKLAKQYGFDVSLLSQGQKVNSTTNKRNTETQELIQTGRNEQQLNSMREKPDTDEAERFGLRMFDAEISTFAPVSAMPVPDNYILGADDQLLLQLFGKQSNEVNLTISRDGKVFVPDVGPVIVGGLSFATAAKLIAERVRQATIGVDAAISMGELRTINVFVVGEAK